MKFGIGIDEKIIKVQCVPLKGFVTLYTQTADRSIYSRNCSKKVAIKWQKINQKKTMKIFLKVKKQSKVSFSGMIVEGWGRRYIANRLR